MTNYVDLKFDVLLNPMREPILPREALDEGVLGSVHWGTRSSGLRIPEPAAGELERLWRSFTDHTDVGSRSARASTSRESPDSGTSAGIGSPETNAKVETAAIQIVRELYRGKGWSVESVENEHCGFDLRCQRGVEKNDVEVKGISGTEPIFFITRAEVAQADTNPHFWLYTVTSALSKKRKVTKYPGSKLRESFDLNPIQFQARPKNPTSMVLLDSNSPISSS